MPSERLQNELVAELRRLGALQLAAFHALNPADVHVKDDSGEPSVVTRWDVETESALRDWVARQFPSHGFLGEELGHSGGDPAHTWICDPIDGTANFVDGVPVWGTSLAYWRDGRPEQGWIYLPALGQMFTAGRGHGAFLNGKPIRSSRATEYTLLTSVGLESRTHLRYTLRLHARLRILGSAIANLAYTASGTLVASYTRAKLWDVAAGVLAMEEAGCAVALDPPLDRIAAAQYGAQQPAISIAVDARANEKLTPLRSFLRPVS